MSLNKRWISSTGQASTGGCYPAVVLTDGAKYLADSIDAYWLMAVIASHQVYPHVASERFQVWRIKVNDDASAGVVADDGNGHILTTQVIEHTDFPIKDFKLYAVYSGEMLVIMLPGEY